MQDSKQKLTGYNNSKGTEYIILHIKKFILLMNTFLPKDIGLLKKFLICFDFVWCVLFYGAGINDYFQYNFYKRKHIDRKEFIVGRKWKKIIRSCNGKVNNKVFDDKNIFNRKFSDFLGREWLDIDDTDINSFVSFCERHNDLMYKVKNGSGGNGIGKLSDLNLDSDSLYKYFKNKHVILEEIINQHSSMSDFNPSSVNTLRVVTIVNGGNVNILSAVFRTGNGDRCTDNFHHYGLAALIDIDSGIVYTPGIDKDNQKYILHPISQKKIVGFEIPFWEKIKETVISAALIEPKVRYVGWDIAIKDNGEICIIEGNCASDPDITQMPDQIGKWSYYKKYL